MTKLKKVGEVVLIKDQVKVPIRNILNTQNLDKEENLSTLSSTSPPKKKPTYKNNKRGPGHERTNNKIIVTAQRNQHITYKNERFCAQSQNRVSQLLNFTK